ncbi:unnamed protein product, partial [Ixodes persulcatus]
MTVSMFTKTASLLQAVSLINQLDDAKFSALLARILQKLHLKDERSFSEEEESRLQKAFALGAKDVTLVLETVSFILEQAAFHVAKPQVLQAQLTALELTDTKVQCLVQAWTAGAKQVVERLKHHSLAARQLQDVGWELRVTGGQRHAARARAPQALVDLLVSGGAAHDHLLLQFSHQQLFGLYTKVRKCMVASAGCRSPGGRG